MPARETPRQRGARRATDLLRRLGEEFRRARVGAGLGCRAVATAVGISHTQQLRIERGEAPHVDVVVLARIAAVLGLELALTAFPVASPLRDRGHVALLARFRARLHASWRWLTEVPMPRSDDRRSADAMVSNAHGRVMVESVTHLDDWQALERGINGKAAALGCDRVILLVSDSRHNRTVIRETSAITDRFPISTRAALAALARGVDPGGDCLVVL
jgi:transcriptional regulator with XRE-family HTH domain